MLRAYKLYAFLCDGDGSCIGTGTLVVEGDDATRTPHNAEGRCMLFEKRPIDVFIEARFVTSHHGKKPCVTMIMRSKPACEEDSFIMVGNSIDMRSFKGELSMGKLANTYRAYFVLIQQKVLSVQRVRTKHL